MLLTPVNAGHIVVGRPRTVLDLTGAVGAFYDANVENSLTLNNQANFQSISQFNDLTVNARHLTQTTAAAQPRLVRGMGNLFDYTQNFSNTYWARLNSTVATNTGIAPNGTNTLNTLTSTTASGFRDVGRSTPLAATTYTLSFYASPGSVPIVVARNTDFSTGGAFVNFNLSTGVITSSLSGTWSNLSSSITNVGNGFSRVRFTVTYTGVSPNAFWGIGLSGNSIGDTVNIWGAMLNLGSTPGEYIGRNALATDGLDDRMFTGSFVLNQPFCRFTVATRRNSNTDARHLVNSRLGSPDTALYTSAANNIVSTAGTNLVSSQTFNEGQTSIFGEIFNGATSSLISNGVVTTGNAGAQGIDGINIGSQNASSGFSRNDIHSHLLLNRLLTTEERLKLESYLGQRWGIPTWRTNAGALGNPWRYHDVQLVY